MGLFCKHPFSPRVKMCAGSGSALIRSLHEDARSVNRSGKCANKYVLRKPPFVVVDVCVCLFVCLCVCVSGKYFDGTNLEIYFFGFEPDRIVAISVLPRRTPYGYIASSPFHFGPQLHKLLSRVDLSG